MRVSTEEQARFGYSIEAQKKSCIEYAQKLEYAVADVFADEGESATAANRPKFMEMLDQCESGDIEAVIVWQTDRFARNTIDHFMVKDRLKKAGTRLISVIQPMLDETPEGNLMDTVLAGINTFYSEDLSRKTKKGLIQKWEEGWWPGWAPLGYSNVKDEQGRSIVIIDPVKGSIVKEGLELFSTGNYTINSLQEWFYHQGLQSRTGKVLQFSVVHGMLRNPFYYGLMRLNGMEKMGNHPPLIKKTTHDLNQYILAKHRSFLIRQRKHDFLLRGFAFCADCGLRYTAEWHKIKPFNHNHKVAYYHCAKRGGCKSAYVKVEELEAQVEKEIQKLEFSQEFIDLVTKKAKEVFEGQRGNIDQEKQKLLNQRQALEIRRNKLEDVLLDNTIDRDTFKRKHLELQAKINALETKIYDLEQKRQVDITFIEEILGLTRDIHRTYKEAPAFLKRHYLRFFFEKFLVRNKKIIKVGCSPIFATLQKEHKIIIRTNWLRWQDSNLQPSP